VLGLQAHATCIVVNYAVSGTPQRQKRSSKQECVLSIHIINDLIPNKSGYNITLTPTACAFVKLALWRLRTEVQIYHMNGGEDSRLSKPIQCIPKVFFSPPIFRFFLWEARREQHLYPYGSSNRHAGGIEST